MKRKYNVLILLTMLILTLTACGKTDNIEDTDNSLIEDLVSDENTNKTNESTKTEGEKTKNDNSSSSENSEADYGDALDGFNIQHDNEKIQLKEDEEVIVSSGDVTDTSLGDMSHMKEYNKELQASSRITDLNTQRFMYETNADIININVTLLDYMENGCSEGKLNGLISKVDLLTTRNNYIQSRMSEDLDILSVWNEYYQFITSLKTSIKKLEVSQSNIDKLNNLTNAVNICFNTRLVGYNYMADVLSSPIENEDNTVNENVFIETENNAIIEENDTIESDNTEDTESDNTENDTIESDNTEDTESEIEEDNTVTVE